MTSSGLDEWFGAMFEPIWTWPRFYCDQLVIWIMPNNDQIWFPMGQMSDSEQYSNRLKLDIISHLVNFLGELGQIMTRFDFLWTRRVILSNVWTDSQLDLISLSVNFSCELEQIMNWYDFLLARRMILRNDLLVNFSCELGQIGPKWG